MPSCRSGARPVAKLSAFHLKETPPNIALHPTPADMWKGGPRPTATDRSATQTTRRELGLTRLRLGFAGESG